MLMGTMEDLLKLIFKASEFSHNIASSYYGIPQMVRPNSWIQQNRPPEKSTSAKTCTHGTKNTDWRIRRWKSLYEL
jgi:hypothetical protein